MSAQELKQLKIKGGTLRRNLKDLQMAQKEVEQEEARLAKFQQEGKEEAALKQQRAVIDDSRQMVPEARKRIAKAAGDLQTLFDAADKEDTAITGSEEYKAAEALLAEVAGQSQ
eukprot:TRINITY_DN54170_c0_g1_i1.p3 TRINITY_DN54170_c0_g1~~TRINITY_DN54170_c0_g1_i1.p3  ORF type:complete len:114 (+),score=36.79 TRINITY_DN54170_c0_g1_i1:121-462(+)